MNNKAFPQVSAVSALKLRIIQCDCAENCKSEMFQHRHWRLLRWDGSFYMTAMSWEFALAIAAAYHRELAEKAKRRDKLLLNSLYGKVVWPWSR
jgi:hypothetical protein